MVVFLLLLAGAALGVIVYESVAQAELRAQWTTMTWPVITLLSMVLAVALTVCVMSNAIYFNNSPSNVLPDYALSIFNGIAQAAAAVGAAWAAWAAARSARAATMDLQLRTIPYLSFDRVRFEKLNVIDALTGTATPHLHIAALIKNPGQIPVEYVVEYLACTLTNPTGALAARYGGTIFPGDPAPQWLLSQPFAWPAITPQTDIGMRIRYWRFGAPHRSYVLSFKVTIPLAEGSPSVYLEGPTYTGFEDLTSEAR